jgi:hypothetical protein
MTRHTMPPALQRFADFLAANPSPTEVVAGKYYMVPCAIMPPGRTWEGLKRVPLLGTVHEDRDVIKFKAWHIHVDTRFLPGHLGENYMLLAKPLSLTGYWPYIKDMLDPWNHPLLSDAEFGVRRFRAFRSEPPELPPGIAPWKAELETLYADASAACGVCPHRQIPLTAGRQMGDGVRQCPGHGLCWDREGRLVRQEVTA